MIANLLLKSIQELYSTWGIARTAYFLDELNAFFVFISGIFWLFKVEFFEYNLLIFPGIIIIEAFFFYFRCKKTQLENPFNKNTHLHFRWVLNTVYEKIKNILTQREFITRETIINIIASEMQGLDKLDRKSILNNILKILYRINFLEKVMDHGTKQVIYYKKECIE
jgi:hypothetical protein